MSKKMAVLSKEAQWFEDNSPLMEEHKKDSVKGVSYKSELLNLRRGKANTSLSFFGGAVGFSTSCSCFDFT